MTLKQWFFYSNAVNCTFRFLLPLRYQACLSHVAQSCTFVRVCVVYVVTLAFISLIRSAGVFQLILGYVYLYLFCRRQGYIQVCILYETETL